MSATTPNLPNDARIVIAGAGAIGCFVGGLLARAGRRVSFLGRAPMVEELKSCGLHLTDFGGLDEQIPAARLAVTADPAVLRDARLVLVTVKSGATGDMAREIAARTLPATVIVSLQNGVDNPATLRAALNGRLVLAGMVGFNVVHMGEGRFHRATSGQVVMEAGRPDAVSLLSVPGISIEASGNITGVQWGKLLLNLNNALNALSDLPLRHQLENREWRRLFADQMAEGLAVLKAARIEPVAMTALPLSFVPAVLRLSDCLFRIAAARMLTIDPEARLSMWEDFLHRRPTEVDYLQGAIVRLAERHRVEVPLTNRVVALVKRAEAAGAGPPKLTPEQIRDDRH
jgi:2-dehydropantoate 2-reductase